MHAANKKHRGAFIVFSSAAATLQKCHAANKNHRGAFIVFCSAAAKLQKCHAANKNHRHTVVFCSAAATLRKCQQKTRARLCCCSAATKLQKFHAAKENTGRVSFFVPRLLNCRDARSQQKKHRGAFLVFPLRLPGSRHATQQENTGTCLLFFLPGC